MNPTPGLPRPSQALGPLPHTLGDNVIALELATHLPMHPTPVAPEAAAQAGLVAEPPAIWVERLSPAGKVLERQRFTRLPVRIGADYSNDLMLDDPAVAPQHLLLQRDADGQLQALPCPGQAVQALGRPGLQAPLPLSPALVLCLGRARLRVRQSGDAADKPFARQRLAPQRMVLAAVCFGLAVALAVWGRSSMLEPSPGWEDLLAQWQLPVLLLAWAAAWAGLHRLLAGHWHAGQHLGWASAAGLAWGLLHFVLPFAAYSTGWVWREGALPVADAAVLGLTAAGHWWHIGQHADLLRARRLLGWALIAGGMLTAVGLHLARQVNERRALPEAALAPPPAFSVRPQLSSAQALANIQALRATAEAVAREPADDELP